MRIKTGNTQTGDVAALEVAVSAPLAASLTENAVGEAALAVEYSPTAAAALTAADGGTVDATYGAAEAAVISNLVARQAEIEAVLVAHGLLTEAA